MDETMRDVKAFILSRYLPEEDPALLTPTTPLITGGILDSLAMLELVSFLETRFGITIEAHEAEPERLDTLTAVAQLVREKLAP